MTAAFASLDVSWCAPDGRLATLDPAGLSIEVAAGVRIDLTIEPRGAARLAVALALASGQRGQEEAPEANGRFVVIPVNDASFLVAVAEPSDEPVLLTPVWSSPRWTRAGGEMPAREGWLTARRPEGAGVEFRIVPGPGEMSVCALQLSAMPPAGARFGNGARPGSSGSVRFSVPRLSPRLLTLECEWVFGATGAASQSWP